MNNSVTHFYTHGRGVKAQGRIEPSPFPGVFNSTLTLTINDVVIAVTFSEPEELILYCRRHNHMIDVTSYEEHSHEPV